MSDLNAIAAAFHKAANLSRGDIFDNGRLMPLRNAEDAETASPGWVGANWKPGDIVLTGINPGGGGDDHRQNPTDAELYRLLRSFRGAASPAAQMAALRSVSDSWIAIQRTHNIWRVVKAVLDATGVDVDRAAFINILPFRTRKDAPARKVELCKAWQLASGPQIVALNPVKVIALGYKAQNVLTAVGAHLNFDIIPIKRSIGDSRITPEASAVLNRLRANRNPET